MGFRGVRSARDAMKIAAAEGALTGFNYGEGAGGSAVSAAAGAGLGVAGQRAGKAVGDLIQARQAARQAKGQAPLPLRRTGETDDGWVQYTYEAPTGPIPMEIRPHTGGQFLEISVDEKNLTASGRLGVGGVRDAIGQIKAEFPDVRVIHGVRISGAKEGGKKNAGLNVDKFPAAARPGTERPFSVSGTIRQGANDLDDAPPAAPLAPAEQEEIATLAKKATSGWGPSARAARKELAQKAKANPEAAAAAQRLGVELPVDILSDDAQLQSLTGLARSQVGSEAETGWRASLGRVAEQSEQAVTDLGATGDLAQLSDDVLRRLTGASESLQRQASSLRDEVTAAVNPAERVDASNLQRAVAGLIDDMGGLKEAKMAMTPQEKSLLAMLGEGENALRPTYARLNRLRDDIGEALNKGKGPWADVNRKQLGEYYKALADDQIAAVEQMGGKELADKQRGANSLFAKMYEQRTATQEIFGKQLDKSLAPLMKRAITSGAKGDAKDMIRLMDRIPEDLRGPAITSALLSQARSSASHGGFSFANYAKVYRGLRQNSPVYAHIAKAVGAPGERILKDLFTLSNRIAAGEAKVLKTGKANQVLSSALQAEGIIGQVVGSAAERTAQGVGAAAGGVVGGPGGAAAGVTLVGAVQNAMAGAGRTRLDKVHNLLNSPQFQTLMERVASGEDPKGAINILYNSPAFHKLAKAVGHTTPEARKAWLGRMAANDTIIGVDSIGLDRQVSTFLDRGTSQLAAENGEPVPSADSRPSTGQERR